MLDKYHVIIASDFHSNATACAAFVAEIHKKQPDEVWLLGDYISDYPLPTETLDQLYALAEIVPITWLRGNREDYFLHPDQDWHPSSQSGSLYHTMKHLRKQDLDFFATLPITQRIQIENAPAIRLAHGSPTSNREHLYEQQESTLQHMKQLEEMFLIVGHTHTPYISYVEEKCLVNVGSIGVPVDHCPDGQYVQLLYFNGSWHPQLCRFSYPYQEEQQRILTSGFLSDAHLWGVAAYQNLATANDECYHLLMAAQKLAKGMPPNEAHFQAAAKLRDLPTL